MESVKEISNWGLYPKVVCTVFEEKLNEKTSNFVQNNIKLIARGNGRCYGDSALSKHIVSTLKWNKILFFDIENGIFEAEAGVLLSDILSVIVPHKWFLPVTPGTKFISLGGALAADIHGKNHHVEGCFSKHVLSFSLMNENGEINEITEASNTELFWKTVGGMGLTGIITRVKFRLKPIETVYINQLSIKAKNLDEIIDLFEQNAHYTYSVAWIDCLQTGKNIGRSILMLGEHCAENELPSSLKESQLMLKDKPLANLPFYFPAFALSSLSIKAFNLLFYNKQLSKMQKSIVHYEPYFYPLDKLHNWNRMYGKSGFTQYQFVIPKANAKTNLSNILSKIAESGEGSFLAVLKLFGNAETLSPMSFPMEGYTLALDFKINENVFKLLDELDILVQKAGGRLYLAKDVRMQHDFYTKTYPKYLKSNHFSSVQSERLGV